MVDEFNPLLYIGLHERVKPKFVDQFIKTQDRIKGWSAGDQSKFEVILQYFCDHTGFDREDVLKSQRRNDDLMVTRKWIIYFTYLTGNYSYKWIGTQFHDQDHSTICYHFKDLESSIKLYKGVAEEFEKHKHHFNQIFGRFVKRRYKSKKWIQKKGRLRSKHSQG